MALPIYSYLQQWQRSSERENERARKERAERADRERRAAYFSGARTTAQLVRLHQIEGQYRANPNMTMKQWVGLYTSDDDTSHSSEPYYSRPPEDPGAKKQRELGSHLSIETIYSWSHYLKALESNTEGQQVDLETEWQKWHDFSPAHSYSAENSTYWHNIKCEAGVRLYAMTILQGGITAFREQNEKAGSYNFMACMQNLVAVSNSRENQYNKDFLHTMGRAVTRMHPFGDETPGLNNPEARMMLQYADDLGLGAEPRQKALHHFLRRTDSIHTAEWLAKRARPEAPALTARETSRVVANQMKDKFHQSSSLQSQLNTLTFLSRNMPDERMKRRIITPLANAIFDQAPNTSWMEVVTKETGMRPTTEQAFAILDRSVDTILKQAHNRLDSILFSFRR